MLQSQPTHVIVEIEAGRTIQDNAYLLDLMKAFALGASYVVLAVPYQYKYTSKGKPIVQDTYQEVVAFVDFLLTKTALNTPTLRGVLVIGYEGVCFAYQVNSCPA